MGLLIDSSCLIAVERGETDLSGLPPEARAVSVVTVSELLQGAYGPSPAKAARGLAWLERLLAAIQPLPIDEPVARVHAHLWNELKRTGSMIGAHDLWIVDCRAVHLPGDVHPEQPLLFTVLLPDRP